MTSPVSNSRRSFLIRAGAIAVAPFAFAACRRSSDSEAGDAAMQQAITPPHNLDDVGQLATYRPPLPSVEPSIRVRVLRVREAIKTRWKIGDADQWLMARAGEGSTRGLAMQGPIEIEMTARGWSIVDGKGFRASVGEHDTIELELLADDVRGLTRVATSDKDARLYRGKLRLISRHDLDEIDLKTGAVTKPSHAFDLINDVPLETYLPGVLAGELYSSWNLNTFAAQAIAARSFACNEAAIFAGRRHYDVSNTAASQMYLGDVKHDRAHEAVALTRGRLLAYEGLLVSGYYSSCCGGVAASATDAIGSNPVNNVPPLHGRSGSDVCTEASVYMWTVEQPADELVKRIAGYARDRSLRELEGLQRLLAIDISASNANGRPTRMAVTDEMNARVEMTAEDFRRAANFSDASSSPSRAAIKPPEKELRSSNFRATVTPAKVIFEGFGFGHGVGLCQHGAEALARAGTSPDDIIRWYYPEVEIVGGYA